MSEFKFNINEVPPLPCNVLFIIGGIGTGKSMLGEFANKHLFGMPNRFPAIDTSACIKESKDRKTPAGEALGKLDRQQSDGEVLPADPVAASVFENLRWHHKEHGLLYAVIMGSPRSPQETEILLKLQAARRINFRVLIVDATPQQMWEGIQRRIQGGLLRADQGPKELVKRLREYKHKTLPAIARLPQGIKKLVRRSDSFTDRISALVELADVRSGLKERMRNRLRSNAVVREEIRKIEQKPPLPPELLVMPNELREFIEGEPGGFSHHAHTNHSVASRHGAVAA